MAEGSTVGFHAAFRTDERTDAPDAVANALVGAYVSQLGLPTSTIVYVTEALPGEMRWLTFDDAARIGISVERFEPTDTDLGEDSVRGTVETVPRVASGEAAIGVWIQILSRSNRDEAIRLAIEYEDRIEQFASVFLYENGWYGVVLGPYPSELGYAVRARLLEATQIPADSLLTRGEGFSQRVWGGSGSEPPSVERRTELALTAAQGYFRESSMPNAEALAFMRRVYAPELLYFGKWATISDVLRDKTEFVARWPERRYTVRPGTAVASCDAFSSCLVEGIVDWWAYSAARNSTSTGSASFRLIFSRLDPPTVVLDESTVLSRQIVVGRTAQ
jgi:hypothetical protein